MGQPMMGQPMMGQPMMGEGQPQIQQQPAEQVGQLGGNRKKRSGSKKRRKGRSKSKKRSSRRSSKRKSSRRSSKRRESRRYNIVDDDDDLFVRDRDYDRRHYRDYYRPYYTPEPLVFSSFAIPSISPSRQTFSPTAKPIIPDTTKHGQLSSTKAITADAPPLQGGRRMKLKLTKL